MNVDNRIAVKVTYTTTDGLEYTDKDEAVSHQLRMDFQKWYGNHTLPDTNPQSVARWMYDNKDMLLDLLKIIEKLK